MSHTMNAPSIYKTGQGLAIPGSDTEKNGYHDSDFYITVYVPETDELIRREYGTTRCAAPTMWPRDGYLTEDSPHWGAAVEAARRSVIASRLARAVATTQTIGNGVKVEVVTPLTRKTKNWCPAGSTGVVKWMKEKRSRHGSWSCGWTVGVDLDDETEEYRGRAKARRVFLDEDRVRPVGAVESAADLPADVRAEVEARWADAEPAELWAALLNQAN